MAPLLSLLLSVGIAGPAWRFGLLTGTGAVAAAAVGTLVLWGTGWPGLLALAAFFVGASAISRLAPDTGAAFDTKGQRRDLWQVIANGGPAALGALVPGAGIWIVTSSLAAAAADTWATAVGGWSPSAPRHVVSWRIVDPGTSGGITTLGTGGALLGATVVAIGPATIAGGPALFSVALAVGMLGMLLDSLL